jgi:hypothetical protein
MAEASLERRACSHASEFKTFRWEGEKFSDRYNTEYQYCDCRICKTSIYTGEFRMVEMSNPHLNRDQLPSAKEQIMSKDKISVSRSIKALHAKSDNSLSLKEFARRLARDDSDLAKNWFANKLGACDASRSESNKVRVAAERSATKSAKRKSKKTASATTPAK